MFKLSEGNEIEKYLLDMLDICKIYELSSAFKYLLDRINGDENSLNINISSFKLSTAFSMFNVS